MSEFKGTKGKWEVCSYHNNSVRESNHPYANAPLARCFDDTEGNTGYAIANALLISKAPEMLEMLKKWLIQYESDKYATDYELQMFYDTKKLIKQATEI